MVYHMTFQCAWTLLVFALAISSVKNLASRKDCKKPKAGAKDSHTPPEILDGEDGWL